MEEKWVIIIVFVFVLLIVFFVGFLIGRKTIKPKAYDGTLLISEEDDREQFRFVFSTELEDLREKSQLVMQIQKEHP